MKQDEPTPRITVSERAKRALAEALETPEERVRLQISPMFEHELTIGAATDTDVDVDAGGLHILLDPGSAGRAEGLRIDYVESANGHAFKIDNPNEPPRVRALSARDLKARLDQGEPLILIDVRTPEEQAIARIQGAKLLNDSVAKEIEALDHDTPLVFQCHHGIRSQRAAEYFLQQGFRKVYNLTGGIDAWSLEVDGEVPRY